MAVIKLGDLTTFAGDPSGSYLVINDSTNTTTYKIQKEALMSGSFAGTASYALTASQAFTASYVELSQTSSYVLQAVSSSYAVTASYVENAATGESVGSKLYLFNAY